MFNIKLNILVSLVEKINTYIKLLNIFNVILIKYNKYVHCSLKHMAWLFRKNFQY